jgi:N-terminal domain of anti-restriction factor ArdC
MTVKHRRQLTDEERAARREHDREYARQAVERLRSSEGWRAWLTTRATFHGYSLGNQLLIAMQRPTARRVAGFKAWLKLGYCVSRGETAIRIWAPCPPSRKQLERWQHNGADPDQRPRTFFKLTAVFADDQVAPLPPPAVPAPLEPPIRDVDGDELAPVIPGRRSRAARTATTSHRPTGSSSTTACLRTSV